MGYYCTVPQCTSLAGKTKNVKFHRFPRDVTMADKWNIILKRGKPYTKYSKVCSLHFTHADYNVTTMGQWKTLSKDAVPSQNLPKLNPDGTVMVIRKSRTVKYKENRREDDETRHQARVNGEKLEKWHLMNQLEPNQSSDTTPEANLAYRLQSLTALANNISPQQTATDTAVSVSKPKKQDAIMQTDPVQSEEDDTQPNNSYSETSDKSFNSELQDYPVAYQKEDYTKANNFEMPKDYTKSTDDYIPQTNEEYNKEAEKYALERKSHNGYDKIESSFASKVNYQSGIGSEKFPKIGDYQKDFKVSDDYQKLPVENGYQGYQFSDKDYQRDFVYQTSTSFDSAEVLRNQQHNLAMLQQQQHRVTENQNFFTEGHIIKQELDLSTEDDKFLYERGKDPLDSNYARSRGDQQRLEQLQHQLKQEPESNGHDTTLQVQQSTYYPGNGHENLPGGYYSGLSRPGPELLIAKQNALAAHTQLWQNSMKRPFFYSDSAHYNTPQLLHRYEDLQRILQ